MALHRHRQKARLGSPYEPTAVTSAMALEFLDEVTV